MRADKVQINVAKRKDEVSRLQVVAAVLTGLEVLMNLTRPQLNDFVKQLQMRLTDANGNPLSPAAVVSWLYNGKNGVVDLFSTLVLNNDPDARSENRLKNATRTFSQLLTMYASVNGLAHSIPANGVEMPGYVGTLLGAMTPVPFVGYFVKSKVDDIMNKDAEFDGGIVGTFQNNRGELVAVRARKGETPEAAMTRVRARHGVSDRVDEFIYGKISYRTVPYEITINRKVPAGRQLLTLIHEMIHAFARLYKQSWGEKRVHDFAIFLLSERKRWVNDGSDPRSVVDDYVALHGLKWDREVINSFVKFVKEDLRSAVQKFYRESGLLKGARHV